MVSFLEDDLTLRPLTPLWLPHAGGRFYPSPVAATTTTFAHALNVMYATAIYIPKRQTYTSINLEVTTLVNPSNIRLGIYSDSGAGAPSARVLDAGTVSGATTGAKTIAISQTLDPGWYWLASVSDAGPTVRALSQTNALGGLLGFSTGLDTTNKVGFSVAFTYAALPDPFTGGGALMTTAAPRIMLSL